MSIKSEKSLLEECSEIIERSYSIRSFSDNTSSCSDLDEDELLVRDLLRKMSPVVLNALRKRFFKTKRNDHFKDLDRKVKSVMQAAASQEGITFIETTAPNVDKSLWIDEESFVDALNNIFDHHKYEPHARKLFKLLDPFSTKKMFWSDLVDRLVSLGAHTTRSRVESWLGIEDSQISMKQMVHCKREPIVKLVSIHQDNAFSYAVISRGGIVGVYSGDIHLLRSYRVITPTTNSGRVKNCWVTDAVYMPDVQCLVVTSSERSVSVYDVATVTHILMFRITSLPHIPTCIAYEPSESKSSTSELVFGDERGHVTRLKFLQPNVSLLYKKYTDKVNCYLWTELYSPPHSHYCSITKWKYVHRRSVRQLAISRRYDQILSCSHDAGASLIFRYRSGKLTDYIFTFARGVTCFHWVESLRLVVTGSTDGSVRVLGGGCRQTDNTTAPIYSSNRSPILDVAVIPHRQIILVYSKNCVVDIFDIYEESLLQSIKIKFPFLTVLGRKVEFGTRCLHPGPARTQPELYSSDHEQEYWTPRRHDIDLEYIKWDKSEILVTSGDYVCVMTIDTTTTVGVLPPPATQVPVRLPDSWRSAFNMACQERIPIKSEDGNISPEEGEELETSRTHEEDESSLLMFSGPGHYHDNIDDLLEKADLKGILEKDFVKMADLKSDLNQKILATEAYFDKMCAPIKVGGPHLALTLHEPSPIFMPVRMEDHFQKVLRLFPSSSSVTSPASGSARMRTSKQNTPRSYK